MDVGQPGNPVLGPGTINHVKGAEPEERACLRLAFRRERLRQRGARDILLKNCHYDSSAPSNLLSSIGSPTTSRDPGLRSMDDDNCAGTTVTILPGFHDRRSQNLLPIRRSSESRLPYVRSESSQKLRPRRC